MEYMTEKTDESFEQFVIFCVWNRV